MSKAGEPPAGASPPPPPPGLIVPAVGSYVYVTTTQPGAAELEGYLYTQDPVTGTLVLRRKVPGPPGVVGSEACELFLVPQASVKSVRADAPGGTRGAAASSNGAATTAAPTPVSFEPLPAVDVKALERAEDEALTSHEERMSQLNSKASAEGQAIFDALHKTMPCSWVDTDSINVLNQVRIDAPYGAANCVSLDGNEKSLERIVKVLEGEKRRRAKKDGGPTPAGGGGDAAAP